ncbi:MAG: hypothetical protein WAU25_15095, partial [Nitrososphaeraceae archaeon]
MKINKMKSLSHLSTDCTLIGFSLLLLTSFLVLPLNVNAAVDIDTSGDGKAAAFDGEEGIATEGDSFCSITNDIAGGKFSSLFEGIVGECDDSQVSKQFLVEYSFTKNPVKIGEKSYLTVTVKDKNSGNSISNAFVTLDINPPSSTSFETSSAGAAVAAAGIASSNQEIVQEKTAQAMNTDNNGRATFTVQVGPKSDLGIYDTELEVTKDSYQSSFEQIDFRVV